MHWPSLVVGSEGTLAIVTAARLRLVPRFEHTVTAMVSMSTMAAAVDLVGHLRRSVPALDAVEFVQPAALDLVADHLGRRPPVAVPAGGTCLVVDCADHDDPTSQLTGPFGASGGVVDVVVTNDATQRRALIEFRDRITEAIALRPPRVALRRSNSTWRFRSIRSPTCSTSRRRRRSPTAPG